MLDKIQTTIIVAITLTVFMGCATRNEIKGFMVQLDSIEQENSQLQKKIDRLDSLIIEQEKLIRASKADQNVSLSQVENTMQQIVGILQDSGFRVSKLDERIESLRREIVQPASAHDTLSGGSDLSDQTAEETGVDLKQIYDTALLDHRKGNYDLAIMGYDMFLQALGDGESDLADDAYYGIAECYFIQEKDNEAINFYQQFINKFPTSDMIPVANYKKGLIYERINKLDLAIIVYTSLIKNYPHSPEANLASDRLDKLSGKN